ncbi:MAG: DUF4258 domain-containing protein [Gammaproteobacteria bacterium]
MDFILTEHAQERTRRRRIAPEWVAATLESPTRTESDPDDPDLVHALRPIPERGFRVLRVIYNETAVPVPVLTAYFDDKVTDL